MERNICSASPGSWLDGQEASEETRPEERQAAVGRVPDEGETGVGKRS